MMLLQGFVSFLLLCPQVGWWGLHGSCLCVSCHPGGLREACHYPLPPLCLDLEPRHPRFTSISAGHWHSQQKRSQLQKTSCDPGTPCILISLAGSGALRKWVSVFSWGILLTKSRLHRKHFNPLPGRRCHEHTNDPEQEQSQKTEGNLIYLDFGLHLP